MSTQEDFTNLDKIKDRIAKLLRMADDASSPNEAAIAASRARKLMDKYQLTRIDVNNSFDEQFAEQHSGRYFAALPSYMNWFCTAVAKYNDCQAFFNWGRVDFKKSANDYKKEGKRVNFRGYQSDVQLAVQMYEMLNEAVNRLCKEWMNGMGYKAYNVRLGKQFKTAAFSEISERLAAMTKERDLLTMNTPEVSAYNDELESLVKARESVDKNSSEFEFLSAKIAEITKKRDEVLGKSSGTSLVLMKSNAVAAHFGNPKYKTIDIDEPDYNDPEEVAASRAGLRAGRSIEITRNIEA